MGSDTSRRRFLYLAGGLTAGIALPAFPAVVSAAEKGSGKESEVNPVEDLMREHGVLRRVLLIYEEAIHRIDNKKEVPSGIVADSTRIIQRFIQDYHEKLEEDEIFPRFEKAGKLDDLVKALFAQHQAGRRLTDYILKATEISEAPKTSKSKTKQDKQETSPAMDQIYGGRPLIWKGEKTELKKTGFPKQDLALALRQFVRMYRPHAAREDTVLFPAFRSIISPRDFAELGEKFEDREKQLLGKDGFERMVETVAGIETKLGMNQLMNFTPKI